MEFQRLTAFLDAIPGYGAPGIDCIVQKNHETIYRHFAGFSDAERQIPMQGNERFYLYSCTKPITIAAFMQLFEQGLFSLDDPLAKFLPEYENMRVRIQSPDEPLQINPEEGETEALKGPILIRQLMSMTAGFGYRLQTQPLTALYEKTHGQMPTLQVVREYAKTPLLYQPGTRWHYSFAHDMIGGLIEYFSGQTLGQYLKEHIFRPLGMKNTFFPHPSVDGTKLMAQYAYDFKTATTTNIGFENEYILGTKYESGGAGLCSTVEDYILFASAMANGGVGANGARILKPETIELIRTPQLTPAVKRDFNWTAMSGYSYGLGVRTMIDPTKSAPVGEFGWGGAAGCYASFCPEEHVAVFYAQHMRRSMEPYIHPQIRNFVYGVLNQ